LRRPPKLEATKRTPSRPPLTAAPMTGNSGAPLEHLVHPAVCRTWGCGFGSWEQSRLRVLEPTFFRKWGRGGRGPGPGARERALRPPINLLPPPGPGSRYAVQCSLLARYAVQYTIFSTEIPLSTPGYANALHVLDFQASALKKKNPKRRLSLLRYA
jgi:hypothetical protein